HRRGVAYVDLHKRENIIVGNDGQPYLVDFQISWQRRTTMGSAPTFFRRGWQYLDERLFSILCQIDLYHWQKHVRRCQAVKGPRVAPPGLIRWHRWLAVPFRQWRRRLLVWCGIRSHQGAAWTERFAEDAFRFPTESSQTTRAAA
ncbi:MAG: hypothetical protein NZ703_09025, partial [Gemmataceae bacterium]|nr:hypothetical protein [Gemmataceae bacterium]